MSFLRFTNDPFENVMRLQKAISRSVSRPSYGLDRTPSGPCLYPALNVFEDQAGDAVVVRAEIPGVDRDSLEIESVGNRLTIAGQREIPTPEGKFRHVRRERKGGEFRRVFRLPFEVNRDEASASYQDGVLTIRLAKAESAKPRQIAIEA